MDLNTLIVWNYFKQNNIAGGTFKLWYEKHNENLKPCMDDGGDIWKYLIQIRRYVSWMNLVHLAVTTASLKGKVSWEKIPLYFGDAHLIHHWNQKEFALSVFIIGREFLELKTDENQKLVPLYHANWVWRWITATAWINIWDKLVVAWTFFKHYFMLVAFWRGWFEPTASNL